MEEAKDFCQARGASLLNLTSLEQSQDLQEWWENRGREGHCGRQAPALWLGIQRLANDKWGDITTNVEAEFSQWYSTEPNNHKGREDCAMVITDPLLAKKAQTANFGWMDVPCDTRQFPFHQNFEIALWTMCQREVDPNQVATEALESSPADLVVESSNGCLPGYTNLGTGCYMFSNQPGTADEGKETCRRTGGYLVEVNNKEEWDVLGKEWELVKKRAESCPTDHPFFWLGVSDSEEEGTWRLGRFGEEVEFTAWEENEPNNWGPEGFGTGGVPGEDCVIAGLKDVRWTWYDAPCSLVIFPLCEQHRGEALEAWKRDAPYEQETPALPQNSSWVRSGNYTFLPTEKGVTWSEAGDLCKQVGGRLAAPATEDNWKELRKAIESGWPQPQAGIVGWLFSLVTSSETAERPRIGWWLGGTDAGQEGRWRWEGGRENISYSSAWFNYSPRNENLFSYGGADCVIAIHRHNFLDRSREQIAKSVKKFGSEYEADVKDDQDWRNVLLAEEEDIKWTDASCSATFIPGFDILLNPVCQMDG